MLYLSGCKLKIYSRVYSFEVKDVSELVLVQFKREMDDKCIMSERTVKPCLKKCIGFETWYKKVLSIYTEYLKCLGWIKYIVCK